MLPDKIYIHEASAPELAEPALKEYHIEYIRKDALLEWAKETYLNENASAIRKVCYKQLIEKLESL